MVWTAGSCRLYTAMGGMKASALREGKKISTPPSPAARGWLQTQVWPLVSHQVLHDCGRRGEERSIVELKRRYIAVRVDAGVFDPAYRPARAGMGLLRRPWHLGDPDPELSRLRAPLVKRRCGCSPRPQARGSVRCWIFLAHHLAEQRRLIEGHRCID
jgi:hypothetical protein